MSRYFSSAWFLSFPLWVVLILFNGPARAVNPPGSYGGAAIAAGFKHGMALKSDGTVWTWGGNEYGQLGDGTTTNRSTPVQTAGLTSVVAIAASDRHTASLKSDGTVWTWGDNSSGQLGDSTRTDRSIPDQVTSLSDVIALAAGGISILMGTIPLDEHHTIALKSDGRVWTWGENSSGQLGDGTTTDRYTPIRVSGISGVVAIAAGNWHTGALKSNGEVWAWGSNSSGQLGDGTTTRSAIPVRVTGLGNVTAIATGSWHTVALKSDGTVWAWGSNSSGQLGNGATTQSAIPVQVTGLGNVAAIAAGYVHTMALKSDGTVWTWGFNDEGQLGDGTTTNRHTPVQVLGPGGSGFLNLLQTTPPPASSAHAINLTISTVSPSRYRLIGTLVDANNQPACGLALASGRCVFTCGPGSPRCEGGADSLPLGQFDLTDLPTEASGALNLQTFASGSLPGLQVVQSDGTIQLVNSGGSRSSSGAINTSRSEVSPGRYRLTGTLVDANNQPACGLALASGRCVFTCGPGSPRCEGGADNLPLGQFDLTDLPAEANGALNLQTFVFGSLPGLQAVNSSGGGGGGGQCSYDITPKSKQFSAQGGLGEVAVSTQNGCSWTAQSNTNWIGITSGSSGTEPGTVKYLVQNNSGFASRTGTLTIAGQEFAVSQSLPDSGGGGGQ